MHEDAANHGSASVTLSGEVALAWLKEAPPTGTIIHRNYPGHWWFLTWVDGEHYLTLMTAEPIGDHRINQFFEPLFVNGDGYDIEFMKEA